MWKGRKVLVTGHTGFKGAWLTAWLHQLGADIMGYSLPLEDPANRLFTSAGLEGRIQQSHHGDILDLERLRGLAQQFQPELILHLAAQSLVRKSYAEPVSTYAVNVLGTTHVLEVARQVESVRAVVVITTDKCYENKEWLWPYRENDRLGGHDPYSNSKACAELVTDAYRRSFLAAQGTLVATARAGNVIGGGDLAEDRLVPDAVRAFSQGQVLEIRSPGATRPWQHVLDPLHGYLLLAQSLLNGQADHADAFNFGPPDEHPVGEVVEQLVAAWPGAAYKTPPGDHPHEASRLHLDSRKAHHLLGWAPRLPFGPALEMTVRFYQRQLEGADTWDLLCGDLRDYQASALRSPSRSGANEGR
jgi:CDP-glucose 4,6-dehydratase